MIIFDLAILDLMLLFDVLRQNLIQVLFSVVNQTLAQTQQNTTELRTNAMYEVQFDCRRIYFEHYLNDQHDNMLRRIFIRDIQNQGTMYLYRKIEQNEPIYLYRKSEGQTPVYLYRKSEILGLLDFEVVLPVGLVYSEDLLRSHIDKFRLPGKTYQIVIE
jgi:hypothetical protein